MLSNSPGVPDFRLNMLLLRNTGLDCGATALQMVLRHLGSEVTVEELKRKIDPDRSGLTPTVGIAAAAAEMGYQTKFFTKSLGFDQSHLSDEYYKRYLHDRDNIPAKIAAITNRLRHAGGDATEASVLLRGIEAEVRAGAFAIVLLDWSQIINKEAGYHGHFAPIFGFNHRSVFVHNSGAVLNTRPQAFLEIERGVFEVARKAQGTDEDIIFLRTE